MKHKTTPAQNNIKNLPFLHNLASEQYPNVLLFPILYTVILTSSLGIITEWILPSIEKYQAVLTTESCEWNRSVWPFKREL